MEVLMPDSAQIREVIDLWTESPENVAQMTIRKNVAAEKARYSDMPDGLNQVIILRRV